jgi:hypothetical protein
MEEAGKNNLGIHSQFCLNLLSGTPLFHQPNDSEGSW